uniref:DUF1115 domain-containing protein n=1 Tax=Thelazia callipaeda TaxID=103827 RepID=A0A0N5CRW9_THECL
LIFLTWEFQNFVDDEVVVSKVSKQPSDENDVKYARFWIYSHHIYDKIKRKIIDDTANALHLNGFFCSGKPGVIIVEGLRKDCDRFWEQIRTLTWKRITLRHNEEYADSSFLRLGKFREIHFSRVEYLSELKKELVKADLEYGFTLLLNL